MLSIVGLGLEPADMTQKGLAAVARADEVYLEKYTSIVMDETEIERVAGRPVGVMFREDVEGSGPGEARVVEEAKTKHVVLLVVGTPLFATTHTEVLIRAQELGIEVEVVHNSSIQNVTGCCGFNSYSFGRTVSIPFFSDTWRPTDFLLNIVANLEAGLHTLCLLDIKINEPTLASLLGKEDRRYTRFMTIAEAAAQIEEAAQALGIAALAGVKLVGVERFGLSSERFTYGTLAELRDESYGAPLHSLIVPSPKGNAMEKEYLEKFFQHYRPKAAQ